MKTFDIFVALVLALASWLVVMGGSTFVWTLLQAFAAYCTGVRLAPVLSTALVPCLGVPLFLVCAKARKEGGS